MRWLIALIILIFTFPAYAHDDANVIETFARIKPSVGALYALQSDGDLDFLCSATAVGREGDATIVLTAYHCVRRA